MQAPEIQAMTEFAQAIHGMGSPRLPVVNAPTAEQEVKLKKFKGKPTKARIYLYRCMSGDSWLIANIIDPST